jgi:Na+-transporting methylmalonyl-CoA/oxaloacetate decarboxylase gamma subunit
MNKILAALIATAFATGAFAQTAAPAAKKEEAKPAAAAPAAKKEEAKPAAAAASAAKKADKKAEPKK